MDLYHPRELAEKLIESYDLDLSKVEDPYAILKIDRVKRILEDTQETEDQQMLQIRNSAGYKIEKHLVKHRRTLLVDKSVYLNELDDDLVTSNRLSDPKMMLYKHQRTKKQARNQLIMNHERSFYTNSYYEDLMWEKKLNKKMFIEIEDERIIDNLQYPDKLFTIKLRITHMGLLQEFNWVEVTTKAKRLEWTVNKMKGTREGKALVKAIEISENMRMWLLISFSNAKKYQKIFHTILPIMLSKLKLNPRMVPSVFKYKRRAGI